MGGFLLISHAAESKWQSEQIYCRGIRAAERIGFPSPAFEIAGEGIRAAVFARENGTSFKLATDPVTGSWLFIAGTYFQVSGQKLSTEQILNHYLEAGADAVANSLEGFFVAMIGDRRTDRQIEEIQIITDIAGSCHAFERQVEQTLIVSSSSLIAAAVHPDQLDPLGCQEFLYTGNIYEERSLWRSVRKLPPASIIRLHGGRFVEQRRYWHVEGLNPEALKADAASEQYWAVLTGAAKKISHDFINPACDLTGGFDSRVLAAGLVGAQVPFSAVVSGNDNDADVKISRTLAKIANVPHIQTRPEWSHHWAPIAETIRFTDGECNALDYSHVLRVHRNLAKCFDISLNGSFGEIARGAWWDLIPGRLGEREPVDPVLIAKSRFVPRLYFEMCNQQEAVDLVEHFTGVVRRTNEAVRHLPNTTQVDNAYLFIRMQRWQGRIASSTSRIWPCLSPFLFRSVMEAVLCTHWSVRRGDSLFRHVLDRYSPKLGNCNLDRGAPGIPLRITNFYRFAGMGIYYWNRLRGRWRRQHGGGASAHVQQRLALWNDDEMRVLLDPETMLLNEMLSPDRLKSFINMSKEASFSYHQQWGRLATLESAYRTVARMWPSSAKEQ